jgi:hypothetical protein
VLYTNLLAVVPMFLLGWGMGDFARFSGEGSTPIDWSVPAITMLAASSVVRASTTWDRHDHDQRKTNRRSPYDTFLRAHPFLPEAVASWVSCHVWPWVFAGGDADRVHELVVPVADERHVLHARRRHQQVPHHPTQRVSRNNPTLLDL